MNLEIPVWVLWVLGAGGAFWIASLIIASFRKTVHRLFRNSGGVLIVVLLVAAVFAIIQNQMGW